MSHRVLQDCTCSTTSRSAAQSVHTVMRSSHALHILNNPNKSRMTLLCEVNMRMRMYLASCLSVHRSRCVRRCPAGQRPHLHTPQPYPGCTSCRPSCSSAHGTRHNPLGTCKSRAHHRKKEEEQELRKLRPANKPDNLCQPWRQCHMSMLPHDASSSCISIVQLRPPL